MGARDHVRPVDSVDYDQVVTELEKTPQSAVREVVGESRLRRTPAGRAAAR
ncbi:hypothetical protein ACFW93_20840 [Streptomyces canus]|uniref:hypothetical protein n=1 Tax=Streptomyces canus TaxID=58343 RepID=UPI003687364E